MSSFLIYSFTFFLYWLGVIPSNCLNTALKVDLELKPASGAGAA